MAGDYCYPVPAHMTAEDGALVEPVAVAVQICKVAGLRGGQTVLVFGCGPIGALCQAVARAYGARRVVGVDISAARAGFAKSFGADAVFVPSREEAAAPAAGSDPVDAARAMAEKVVAEFGLGDGADVVLECTGAEACIQAGVFAAKKGGTFVQAGMGKEVLIALCGILVTFEVDVWENANSCLRMSRSRSPPRVSEPYVSWARFDTQRAVIQRPWISLHLARSNRRS